MAKCEHVKLADPERATQQRWLRRSVWKVASDGSSCDSA